MAKSAKTVIIASACDLSIRCKVSDTKTAPAQNHTLVLSKDNHTINQQQQKIPDEISVEYSNDYDILYIHNIVLNKLASEMNLPSLKLIEQEIEREAMKVCSVQTKLDRKQSLERINMLQNKLSNIASGKRYNEYISSVNDFIEQYKKIGPDIKRLSFISSDKKSTIKQDEETLIRADIVTQFLHTAAEYIKLNISRKVSHSNYCDFCKEDLSDVVISDNNLQVCPNCLVEKYIPSSRCHDEKMELSNYRSGYNSSSNFHKALRRYQGKQVNKIPQSLLTSLDTYFVNINRSDLIAEKAKEYFTKHNKAPNGANRHMMHQALQVLGYSAYYEDINLLMNMVWSVPLHNISHLEPLIMDHYSKTQEVYLGLDKTRKSDLGTQYRLFKHLQLVGYPVNKDDFKIISSPVSFEFHEHIWKQMCDICHQEDKSIYFIPTI